LDLTINIENRKMGNTTISILQHSGVYTLTAKQKLPVTLEEAWDFFSNPSNLAKITPSEMGFKITSGEPKKMFAGQIITYEIGIFPFIKSNWVTEITQVKENNYFIDEQRFGPYRMWHHEHYFARCEEGTCTTDCVTYKLPFGFIGKIVHYLFIRKKLMHIFSYRSEILFKRFSEK